MLERGAYPRGSQYPNDYHIVWRLTDIIKLPLLDTIFQEKVEVISLSRTNTHNACRNGLGVIVSTALLGEPLRDFAVTESLLAHFKYELIIGVQVCSHALVVLNS